MHRVKQLLQQTHWTCFFHSTELMSICMRWTQGQTPSSKWMCCKGLLLIFYKVHYSRGECLFEFNLFSRYYSFPPNSKMSSISMSNLTISSRILGLAELGEYQSFNAKIPQTNYKGSNIKTSELATIILAIVVFTGGLATAFCVVCVRCKRWANINSK